MLRLVVKVVVVVVVAAVEVVESLSSRRCRRLCRDRNCFRRRCRHWSSGSIPWRRESATFGEKSSNRKYFQTDTHGFDIFSFESSSGLALATTRSWVRYPLLPILFPEPAVLNLFSVSAHRYSLKVA